MQSNDSTCSIPLTQGQVALCDVEDFEALAKFKWYAWWAPLAKTFYAIRGAGRKPDGKLITVRMHRQIMGEPDGLQVDHRDGNGLNNRRENLRTATVSQNAYNRKVRADSASGIKGVSFSFRDGKWIARIQYGGKRHCVGYFDTAEEASAAYVAAAKKHHGEYAKF